MGNAGRNGGEYYTPRPLIRAMIEVTGPKLGETIYDGACGSAGLLCEAWEHLRRDDLSASAHGGTITETAELQRTLLASTIRRLVSSPQERSASPGLPR